MKHRVGYIGYGGMGGGYHWEVAHDRADVCDDLKPVAVYDLRESCRQKAIERGLKAYTDLDEFLSEPDMDIVVVACSNNFHCEMTCKALRAGKHVICEKPAAMSVEEFDEMCAVSEETGKLLFIHQNRRFDRDFLYVKDAYEKNRFGELYNIESTFCGGTLQGWRAFKDHAGGILYDWGVHLIDQIVSMIDKPVVKVLGDIRCEKNREVDDRSAVTIYFENGVKAKVTVAGTFLAPGPRFAIYGEKGVMWCDEIYADKSTFRFAKSSAWEYQPADVYGPQGAYVRNQEILGEELTRVAYPDDGTEFKQDWAELYKNMINTIEGKEEMLVRHDQVRTVLQIIDAAFKSSESGEFVYIK